MIKTQPYQIRKTSYFHDISNNLDQRKTTFLGRVKAWISKNDPDNFEYPKWMLNDFFFHWTQIPDNGRKMLFEREKTWATGGRLRTWKNVSAKDPRWKISQHQIRNR